ncbi:MAG: hypothetical protein PF440_07115 [Thiomicrorhabdus sp.]|jgi:hypothetical protein|nr:hypothetical protein [Thiomicrorhabdus sp.]
MDNNIPRVMNEVDYQMFFNAVKDVVDTLTGKKRNTKYTRALRVQDMLKLGIDLDRFLNSDKQNPYAERLDLLSGVLASDGYINLVNPVYEDLQVSISSIRVPAANFPTERLYNHGITAGVTFPVLGFTVNDYIYFDVQTHHAMKLNTILDSHMHYMTPTDGSGTPDRFQFQLDVIAAGITGSWAVPSGSPFTSEHIITDDYTNSHELLEIADIPAANTTVSSVYSCKLTRIAATQDEYASEVYLKFTDCHFQKDTLGSEDEDSK